MVTEADWHRWRPGDLRPYVLHTVELFGLDRVMYGSDWPVCLLAAPYDQMIGALEECLSSMSDCDRAKVFGNNAARFYHLAKD